MIIEGTPQLNRPFGDRGNRSDAARAVEDADAHGLPRFHAQHAEQMLGAPPRQGDLARGARLAAFEEDQVHRERCFPSPDSRRYGVMVMAVCGPLGTMANA